MYFGGGGDLHHFPPDDIWTPVNQPVSFKTLRDSAGNIQLTFAQNAGGDLLCDIDLDDHKGLQDVAEVKHIFSGKALALMIFKRYCGSSSSSILNTGSGE